MTGRVSIVQNGGADQTINGFFRFYPKIEMIQILLFFFIIWQFHIGLPTGTWLGGFHPKIQLNLHETDLLFWYLSHHLTWHDLLRFERNLQHLLAKLFLLLFLNNFTTETITKTIMRANAANFLQIFRNTGTLPCQIKNNGSSIEIIDQSHGD